MTANTGVHTCSYYCERPECIKRQRDELRDRMEAALAQQPAAPSGAAASADPAVWVAADTLNSPHPKCISSLAYVSQLDKDRGREYVPLYTATQQPAAQQQRQAVALPKLKRTHPDYSREEVQWVFGYNAALDDVMRLNKNTAFAAQQQGGRDHG